MYKQDIIQWRKAKNDVELNICQPVNYEYYIQGVENGVVKE